MSTGYQIVEQDEIHYITFQVVKWVDVFTLKIYRDIVIDSLRFCQINKGLEIFAFVVINELKSLRISTIKTRELYF